MPAHELSLTTGQHPDGHPPTGPLAPDPPPQRQSSFGTPGVFRIARGRGGTHLEVAAAPDAGAGEDEHGSQQPLQRQPRLGGRASQAPHAGPGRQKVLGEDMTPVLPRQPAWAHARVGTGRGAPPHCASGFLPRSPNRCQSRWLLTKKRPRALLRHAENSTFLLCRARPRARCHCKGGHFSPGWVVQAGVRP